MTIDWGLRLERPLYLSVLPGSGSNKNKLMAHQQTMPEHWLAVVVRRKPDYWFPFLLPQPTHKICIGSECTPLQVKHVKWEL